jgi:hypothetical protein
MWAIFEHRPLLTFTTVLVLPAVTLGMGQKPITMHPPLSIPVREVIGMITLSKRSVL